MIGDSTGEGGGVIIHSLYLISASLARECNVAAVQPKARCAFVNTASALSRPYETVRPSLAPSGIRANFASAACVILILLVALDFDVCQMLVISQPSSF